MDVNKELDLAWDFVNNTDRDVFLTGKAGTGKTTFLHKLKMKSLKLFRILYVVVLYHDVKIQWNKFGITNVKRTV